MENFKFSSDVLGKVNYFNRPETGSYPAFIKEVIPMEIGDKVAIHIDYAFAEREQFQRYYIHNSNNDAYGLDRFIQFYVAVTGKDLLISEFSDILSAIEEINAKPDMERVCNVYYNRIRDSITFQPYRE